MTPSGSLCAGKDELLQAASEALQMEGFFICKNGITSIFRGVRNRVFQVTTSEVTNIRKNSVSPPVY
jgi:hypothetical protein